MMKLKHITSIAQAYRNQYAEFGARFLVQHHT
jgi:hypothetical protein